MKTQRNFFLKKTRKPCAGPYGCMRKVITRVYVKEPICRRCRRRLRNLKLAPYRRGFTDA